MATWRREAVRKSGASTGLSDAVKVSLLQSPKLGLDSSAARRSPRFTAPLSAGLPLLPPPLPVSSAPAPPENSRRFLKRNPAVSGSRQSSPPAHRCCYRREGGARASGSRPWVLTCNGGKRKWPCCATTGAAGSASIPRPIPTVREARRRPRLALHRAGGRPWAPAAPRRRRPVPPRSGLCALSAAAGPRSPARAPRRPLPWVAGRQSIVVPGPPAATPGSRESGRQRGAAAVGDAEIAGRAGGSRQGSWASLIHCGNVIV